MDRLRRAPPALAAQGSHQASPRGACARSRPSAHYRSRGLDGGPGGPEGAVAGLRRGPGFASTGRAGAASRLAAEIPRSLPGRRSRAAAVADRSGRRLRSLCARLVLEDVPAVQSDGATKVSPQTSWLRWSPGNSLGLRSRRMCRRLSAIFLIRSWNALALLDVYTGPTERAPHYLVHTGCVRLSWKPTNVEERLSCLPRPAWRQGRAAYEWLVSAEDCPYGAFLQAHDQYLHARQRLIDQAEIEASAPLPWLPSLHGDRRPGGCRLAAFALVPYHVRNLCAEHG